ncbi:hypothetical protein ACXZ1K_13325 [Pedobacter sp. PWIIR3]
MLFRKTLLYFAFFTLFLAGCKKPNPIVLAGMQFQLLKVAFDNVKYKETTCQFYTDRVEIFSFTDARKWYANVIIGNYQIKSRKIKMPFGEFDIARAKDGYYLSRKGGLKYKLLEQGGPRATPY